MDKLNLGSDEAILKKNQKIIVSGSRCEAILTNRRLILTDRETGDIREDIQYADISLGAAGLNSIREPVLRLRINPPSGEPRSVEIIFVYQPAGINLQDLERSIAILREHKVTIQGSAHLDATNLMSRVNAVSTSLPTVEEPAARPAVPDMSILGSSRTVTQPVPVENRPRPYLFVIAAALVILVILLAGAFIGGLMAPSQHAAPLPGRTPVPTTEIIPATPPVTEVPVLTITTVIPMKEPVPVNGTWVRIAYPGNYTGSLKSGGWNIEINTTGTSDYLLPVRDNLIEGSIVKTEGDGDTMVVGVYYYGTLISEQSTSKPRGVIDLHLDIQQALRATPTPAPAVLSGDLTVPSVSAPPSGVWARVFYPGEYVGYFRANGRTREVNSTGDQFFQLAMTTGSIDGLIEKQDYTSRNMAVQIYKDGSMVASKNTTVPHRDIDLHVTI